MREQGDRLRGKNVLIVLPDSGNRYLSKVYDDDWMEENGFMESTSGTVEELLHFLQKKPGDLCIANQNDKISKVVEVMSEVGISQMPVTDSQGWIKGVIREGALLQAVFKQKASGDESISSLLDTSIEFIDLNDSIDKISRMITEGRVPLVTDPNNDGQLLGIITNIDVLNFVGTRQ